MATRLPPPATTVELYLAAVLEELRALHALLQVGGAAADPAAPGTEDVLPVDETASAATNTATNKPRGTRRR